MLKIYLLSPPSIKKYTLINLVGAIIAGPISAFIYVFGTNWYIPGLDYITITIGAILTAYAFLKEPKIGYVLQFKIMFLCINTSLT